MAQTSYTPISLYYSATGGNTPLAANLVAGELAINTADGKLFYKDSSGVVQTIATKGGVNGTFNGQVLFNSSGAIGGSNNLFWDNSNGYLGIGTSSPNAKLGILQSSNASGAIYAISASGQNGNAFLFGISGVSNGYAITNDGSNNIAHIWCGTGGSERMRIDSSGNVGIGTTSPNSILNLYQYLGPSNNSSTVNSAFGIGPGGATNPIIAMRWTNTNPGIAGYNYTSQIITDTSNSQVLEIYNTGATPIVFGTSATERMRIDSSGNLLVGTTAGDATTRGIKLLTNGTTTLRVTGSGTAFQYNALFGNANGDTGSITTSGTTTAYNTSSDYRLKENIQPMQNALGVVAQLKPVTYTWKTDGSDGQGFIAHELQEVVPDCVTGEKDATCIEQYEIEPAIPATFDEKGNEITPAVKAVMGEREVPVYQGIDTSFLVATLTAAIQEQQVMINELKAKVAALEAA